MASSEGAGGAAESKGLVDGAAAEEGVAASEGGLTARRISAASEWP